MNRRQWKKACKKAAERLRQEFPGQYVFEPAAGDETVYGPSGYQPPRCGSRAFWNIERRYATVPRGAPIIWEPCYTDCGTEWDCRTALEIYQSRRFAEDFDWEGEMRRLEQQSPVTQPDSGAT